MNVYSIHVRDIDRENNIQIPKLVLVRDGYCLWATLFGPLWALVNGLWETALIFFAVQIILGFLINEFIGGSGAQVAAQIGIAVIIGIVANELKRWNLFRRGFDELDSVSGFDSDDAERRFFETSPSVLSQLQEAA